MNIHIYGAYCHGYQIVYKHWNYEIVRQTRLHPNLLTDWHDALVGISPCTTQPITTNHHLRITRVSKTGHKGKKGFGEGTC